MTTNTFYSNRKLQVALSLVCLYAIFWLLHSKTLAWPFGIIDSPILLAQAILYSPLEYFTSPSKYQFLTYNNFTPWVTLSWDIDYSFFTFESTGYRAHHLASAAALLGIVYLLLYRFTHSVLNVSVFCFAMVTLPATLGVIDDLVNRHYLEGMVLCLLSVYCAAEHRQKQHPDWLLLSVFFYALSISAKEVFIPLPGILFFILPGGFCRKVRLISPYAITLLAYLGWRAYMLGGYGGYTSAEASLSLFESPYLVMNISERLVTSLFVTPVASLVILAIVALLLVVNFRNLGLDAKLGLLVGTLGIVLPLLALLPLFEAGFFSTRWIFVPSIALLIFLAYLCDITKSRALAGAAYLIVFAISTGAAALRVQAPDPFYVKGGGELYKQILRSDSDSYLQLPNFSEMGTQAPDIFSEIRVQGQAVWVYIAKLHNGTWGTLPISDRGQLRYHDTDSMKAIKMGRKKLKAETADDEAGTNLDLLEGVNFDSLDGSLTFNLSNRLNSKSCFVYFFGAHNGLLFQSADCRQWGIEYRKLEYLLRMTGYSLPEVSIAVWSGGPNARLYSRPYKLQEFIDLNRQYRNIVGASSAEWPGSATPGETPEQESLK